MNSVPELPIVPGIKFPLIFLWSLLIFLWCSLICRVTWWRYETEWRWKFVSLSVSVYLSICFFMCVPFLPVYISVNINLCTKLLYMPICLCLSGWFLVCLVGSLSVCFIYLPTLLFTSVPVYLSIYLYM